MLKAKREKVQHLPYVFLACEAGALLCAKLARYSGEVDLFFVCEAGASLHVRLTRLCE